MKTNKYKTYGKSRSLRLKDFDYSTERPYFITVCTRDGKPLLTEDTASKVVQCLSTLREKYLFRLYAYCIMPDHVHLLLFPGDSGLNISRIVQQFKGETARVHNRKKRLRGLWQNRFYDHIVRREEDLNSVALYILENPVRKGLVRDWQEYPFCAVVDRLE